MIKERAWPAKVMYMLIAAALAISLIIMVAPAQKTSADCTADVCAEWEMVDTPTTDDWVLSPGSVIIDYHTADADEVAYAVVMAFDDNPCNDEDVSGDPDPWTDYEPRLLKSDDYAATWTDITEALEDEIDVDGGDYIYMMSRVATDWEDPDFVAVALVWFDQSANASAGLFFLHVFFSTDGGTTFEDADEVEDGGVYFNSGIQNWGVADLVVSPESGAKRDIFIGGQDDSGNAALFRCTVTGDSASAWEDVTDTGDYEGWDNQWPSDSSADDIDSELVTDIVISSSWTTDKTVLVTTVSDSTATGFQGVYLQCGSMGTSPGWNAKSSLGIDAVEVKTNDSADVLLPMDLEAWDARGIAGLVLPEDYNSKNTDETVLWAWVNYWDSAAGNPPMCDIMRVEDDSADLLGPMGQIEDGELWITNISYHGTIAEGEAIAGVLGDGGMDYNGGSPDLTELFTPCCDGVQVYRNDGIRNMDICCERWHDACKPPTGRGAMAVTYVGDDKAYAVALMGVLPFDEGAWSVSFDDGDSWNQLSLIDTDIDYLSDVAVSPDCNKTFLASVQEDYWQYDVYIVDPATYFTPWECVNLIPTGTTDEYDVRWLECDSVWLHAEDLPEAEEYSGQWLRTWCGLLEGDNHNDFPYVMERSLLRLAPEETTGDNVFLVDRMSGNVYWNDMETLACWESIASTAVVHIVDLVAQDAETLFALDLSGEVSMFDDDEWQEEVDSELDAGWCIAVWDNQVLVGGQDGDVSYSADFDPEDEDTFTELEKVYDHDQVYVNVAFDSYFDQNDTIYAALAHAYGDNGIYLLVIDGEKEEWTKLAAYPYDYTGIKLDTAAGNPMTGPDTGGVLYASYQTWHSNNCDDCCGNEYDGDNCWHSGVARCLTPIVEICCGAGEDEWDYLTWGLDHDVYFSMQPQALKICGCLTAASNSKLFAIDGDDYDICEHEDGAVWTFEDCYAKKAVELISPDDGEVIDSSVCEYCENEPFKISWDRLCDACCYEIEFAMDEDFTDLYDPWDYYDEDGDCYNPEWICPDAPMEPSYWVEPMFLAETTYYWRVRAVEAETCQDILSWWSEVRSFMVAPTTGAAAIDLVSPEPGATGVAIKNLGFSWDLTATADSFKWVLSGNADLTSPLETATVGNATTAYKCTKTLSYGTTYFWQVTAYNEGTRISTSAVGTFTTTAQGEFCCPQCGLCFDTQAELEDHIADAHPAQPATPMWVWVVIAIGAVLVIVVIVLIFRTRRV